MKTTISPLRLFLLLVALSVTPEAWSQPDQWAWFKGERTPNTQSQFGSAASKPMRPSARNAWGATWQTPDGLLWMFGGYGKDALGNTGALNDLWNYNPATKVWTWVGGDSLVNQPSQYGMRGEPSKDNKPGGRYGAASGIGSDGNFYLFGGYGNAASTSRGFLNDVWRFDPKEKTWTWLNGDNVINQPDVWGTRGVAALGNKPGGKYEMAGFAEGKNFYVFGGRRLGCNSCSFNDLWKYDIEANQWTWIGGDNIPNQPGSYGEKGVEDPQNKPGARFGVVMSVYGGQIYVFGGVGLNNADTVRFNDLWRFDPASGQWTWTSGDRKSNEPGFYGTKGVADAANQPGARDGVSVGFDQSGHFYVFGGTGLDKNGNTSELNDLWKYELSSGKWTWLSGNDQIRSLGSYGAQGVPSGANTPGARGYAAHWFNTKDKLWLFGGILHEYEGSAGAQFSDLWMYNPDTKEWTWVSGEKKVNDAGSYTPYNGTGSIELGARSNGARWTDKSGNLWFYGGYGTNPEGRYGDLWKYDIGSNSWSFVKGDPVPNTFGFGAKGQASGESRPRSREGAVSWVDNEGDLWLFGGLGLVTNTGRGNRTELGQLNDLWEYNIRSNQWIWVGGDTTGNNKGIYGTSGSGSRISMPGSRMEAAGWTDAQGNFWLYGGLGYDVNSNKEGLLNDLWKFNPGMKEWTWVSGHRVSDQPGVYGERGVPAGSSHPGSRHQAMYWSDGKGGMWLFGGYGMDAARNGGRLNDLWRYDITASSWIWIGGDTIRNSAGQYGTKGKALPGNWPGSRTAGATWFDGHDLWLFGGAQAPDVSRQFNDLWRYNPETGFWTWVSGDNTINNLSQYGTKGSFAPGNKPGSRAATVTWTTGGRFWMFGGHYYHTAGSIHDRNNELWAFVPSPCTGLPANISPLLDSIYCPTDSVTLTASGGSSYQWLLNDTVIAGATAAVYQANKAGVYQAIVYSGTSCHAVTKEATVHVTGWKPNIKSSILPATASLCENGAVTIRVQYDKTGPKPTFRWFKNGVQVPGITADTLVVQEAATYTVQESYCSGPFETVPGSTEVSDAVMTSLAVIDASCGQSNGSIALTISGGKAPYTFTWTGPDDFRSTKEDVDGLASGTYKVEIRDAAGCIVTLNPEVKSAASTLSATATVTPASCEQANGTVRITASGGKSPYSYRLGNGSFDSEAEFTGLPAGSHTVTVKDDAGCTFEVKFTVTNQNSDLKVAPIVTDAVCGQDNGAIALAVTGGTAPFTYTWTGPNNFSSSEKDVDGLAPGTYKVVVKDAVGCTVTLNPEIKQGSSTLSATATTTGASCSQANGSVKITASGGKSPYTYSLDNGAFEAPAEFMGLTTGAHSVVVKDAANCSFEVKFTISSLNSDLAAASSSTPAACGLNNGAIALTVSGGKAPYTFVWTGPANFTATEKDIKALAAGIYQVMVKDALGCTATESAEVKEIVSTLKISAATTDAACGQANGAASITVSGGTAPYTYRLGTGAFVTASEFKNLSAGSYTVTTKDAAGCTAEVKFTIASANSDLRATEVVMDASCGQDNGAIDLSVTGGTTPYTFTWTGPDNFSSTQEDIDELAAGTYKVVVQDAAGCTVTLNPEVKEGSSDLTVTAATIGTSCGQANGSVKITASGGKSPYSYRLDNGTFDLEAEFTGLPAGSHTVTVKDDAGCTFELKFTIASANSDLSATDVVTDASCGGKNGSIALTVTGGKAPYTFTWTGPDNFRSTKEDVDGLASGTYKVEIRDAAGCTVTLNPEIKQGSSTLTAIAATKGASCGQDNGSASITVSGGTAPYTYRLGTGAFDSKAEFKNLLAGSYTVMVKDGGGCTFEVRFVIASLNTDLNAVSAVIPAACGLNNGTISLTVSGGKVPYTFDWTGPSNFRDSGKDIDSLAPGTYKVVVKDATGCTVTINSEVKGVSSTLKASAVITDAACGLANGAVNISVSGGTAPYTYSLDAGTFVAPSTYKNLAAGSYTVTVRDATGCTTDVKFTIRLFNSDLNVRFTVTNALCEQSNGAVELNVTGGKAPYTYHWTGQDNFRASTKDLRNLPMGIYMVEVQDALGCQYTLNAEVKKAASTLSATATTTPVTCSSTSGSVQITVSGGTTPYTYSLDNGAFGTISRYMDVSPGSHKVVVKDGSGCLFEMVFIIDIDNKLPNVVINNPAPLCTNATADLTAAAIIVGSDTGLQFTYWRDTAARTPLPNPAAASAGTYYIKGVGQNGCAVIKPVHVSINTTPAGTITPASASVCTGGSSLLTASTGTAYQWYHNGTIIPGATGDTYSAAKAGDYNVFISDGACLVKASNTVTVSISAVDTTISILGLATVCEDTVQLKAGTGDAYQWYRDGVKLEGDTLDHYTASGSGKYTVSVTNQQGCTASSREVNVTVLQKPTADFTVNASCAGEPVSFTNLSAVINSGAVTYLWKFAAGQTSGQRTPNYIYREPGTYEVSLTVTQNACPQNMQTVTKTLEVKKKIPGTTYGAVNAVASVPFAMEARPIGIEYNWTPATGLDNPRIQSPKVNISRDQTYIIEIKTASGCITRDTVQVQVLHSKVNAYVPTAFTPNGNGQNDKLRPILFNIPKLTYFKVFNRWGQLVFQTSQMGEGWDGTLKGKPQPPESYRWILECVDAGGKPIKMSGTSLLIK